MAPLRSFPTLDEFLKPFIEEYHRKHAEYMAEEKAQEDIQAMHNSIDDLAKQIGDLQKSRTETYKKHSNIAPIMELAKDYTVHSLKIFSILYALTRTGNDDDVCIEYTHLNKTAEAMTQLFENPLKQNVNTYMQHVRQRRKGKSIANSNNTTQSCSGTVPCSTASSSGAQMNRGEEFGFDDSDDDYGGDTGVNEPMEVITNGEEGAILSNGVMNCQVDDELVTSSDGEYHSYDTEEDMSANENEKATSASAVPVIASLGQIAPVTSNLADKSISVRRNPKRTCLNSISWNVLDDDEETQQLSSLKKKKKTSYEYDPDFRLYMKATWR